MSTKVFFTIQKCECIVKAKTHKQISKKKKQQENCKAKRQKITNNINTKRERETNTGKKLKNMIELMNLCRNFML